MSQDYNKWEDRDMSVRLESILCYYQCVHLMFEYFNTNNSARPSKKKKCMFKISWHTLFLHKLSELLSLKPLEQVHFYMAAFYTAESV